MSVRRMSLALSIVTLFSVSALAGSFSWNDVLVMRMASMPRQEINCGTSKFVIGGTKVEPQHLVYAMKDSAISCKTTGPRGMRCEFDASTQNQNSRIVTMYQVKFSVGRGKSGAGPFVLIDDPSLECNEMGQDIPK